MRKFFLLTTFFTLTPVIVLATLLFLLFQNTTKSTSPASLANNQIAFAAATSTQEVLSERISSQDYQTELIRLFLARYKSPLEPYAEYMVQKSHEHGLDPRLIPAIAMQESTLCKKIPKNSYNCWGFGIYGGKITRFNDYGHAIDVITKTLGTKYKERGLSTPEEIMTVYTPSSSTWAENVSYFMKQMEE